MPIVRITLLKGKSPEYLAAISKSLYEAMREEYFLSEGDLFHVFEQLDPEAFIFDRNFGTPVPRTDDFLMVQIVSDARRAVEKSNTFKAIRDKLAESPGVKPQDIVVQLATNNNLEDFSLSFGEAAGVPPAP